MDDAATDAGTPEVQLASATSRLERHFTSLSWFVKARYAAAAGILAIFFTARYGFDCPLDGRPVAVALVVLLVANVGFDLMQRRMRASGSSRLSQCVMFFEAAQMIVDVGALAYLVHRYGGVENPFAVLFFWHIAVGSVLGRWHTALLRTTLILALYSGLLWSEYTGIVDHHALPGLFREPVHTNGLWVLGVTLAFVLGGYALCGLTVIVAHQFRLRGELLYKLAAELEVKNNELLAQRELQEGFFRVVAHEMKRPVAASVQLLDVVDQMYAAALPPEAARLLTRARSRIASILALVKDLVSFVRLERPAVGGGGTLPTADLETLMPTILEEHTAVASGRGIEVKTEVRTTGGNLELAVNVDDFSLVAHNLISNAIRYNRDGGEVRIRVAPRADGRFELSVADDGIGIPPADQARIFDEFYRSKAAKQHSREGSGLGMALVKKVVVRAGGEIRCESTEGRGTTFTICWPIADATTKTRPKRL